MSYKYDIFLSYKREPPISDWVMNHFYPELKNWLASTMPREPQIFLDQLQETGVNWPIHLRQALLKSRCLVAVWAPQYFRSSWCLAEWHSMLAREKILGLCTDGSTRGLVYPVIFQDGTHFPETAQRTLCCSLKGKTGNSEKIVR
jgi:hypothetical protein